MKGIAIPYIIAIILGIAVVVIIGASFFGTSGNLNTQDCQNKLATYCTVWQLSGYSGSGPSGGWKQFSTACFNLGVGSDINQEGCDKLLGRTTGVAGGARGTQTADRTGKAGGHCNRDGTCDSNELECKDTVCIPKPTTATRSGATQCESVAVPPCQPGTAAACRDGKWVCA